MSASIHYDSLKSLSQPSHVQWRTCTYWNFGWNWAFALLVSFRDHLDRESPVETRNITVHVAQWPMPLLARDVSKILTTSASFFVFHLFIWRTLLRLPLGRYNALLRQLHVTFHGTPLNSVRWINTRTFASTPLSSPSSPTHVMRAIPGIWVCRDELKFSWLHTVHFCPQ